MLYRRSVLEFLVNNDALSEGLRSRMLGWRHSGFSAHNEVRVCVRLSLSNYTQTT